jgi:hypothetical protein
MKRIVGLTMIALLSFVASANASILDTLVRTGENALEDADAEVIIKGAGNTQLDRFEEGDSVRLYLRVETITNAAFFGTDLEDATGDADYALIGRGTFTIIDIDDPDADGIGDFQFEGSIDFREETNGDTFDFTQSIAFNDAVFAAATPIFSIGTSDANDFIQALDAPIEFADIPTSGTSVDADFGLSLVSGGIAGLTPDGMTDILGNLQDFVGSTQTFRVPASAGSEFQLRTNTDFVFAAVVPEPASFAVWGGITMLLGGARALRRRKTA